MKVEIEIQELTALQNRIEELEKRLSKYEKKEEDKELNEQAQKIIDFLNDKVKQKWPNKRGYTLTSSTSRMVKARLKEYDERTLRGVIAYKFREWKDNDKMNKYLRPSTLFNATKCADYVGELG